MSKKNGQDIEAPIRIATPTANIEKKTEVSGLTMQDDDKKQAFSALAEAAFNFPRDKILSWSRWLPREIPLIASELTRMCVIDPKIRPKNPDGSPRRLSVIYIEWIAWLRLAEKGALRQEAKEFFQASENKEGTSEGWPSRI